jgi:hypothetical protein
MIAALSLLPSNLRIHIDKHTPHTDKVLCCIQYHKNDLAWTHMRARTYAY